MPMFRRFPFMLIVVLMLLIPQAVGASDYCSTHLVHRGENLFRISLRYGVSMSSLAAANNIGNISLIYAGQVLYIPCAGSTSTGSQTTTTTSSAQSAAQTVSSGGLNCAGFRATSPVDGFENGNVTFYWDPPKSSDQIARYQVRILNAAGYEVGAYEMLNVGTSMRADVSVGAIGPGNNFVWYAVGVTADKRICQTQLVYLPRAWTQ